MLSGFLTLYLLKIKIQERLDYALILDLNKATPKDEYPMPIADMLINDASGHKVISFLMAMLVITRSLWPKKTCLRLLFVAPALSVYLSGSL